MPLIAHISEGAGVLPIFALIFSRRRVRRRSYLRKRAPAFLTYISLAVARCAERREAERRSFAYIILVPTSIFCVWRRPVTPHPLVTFRQEAEQHYGFLDRVAIVKESRVLQHENEHKSKSSSIMLTTATTTSSWALIYKPSFNVQV